MKILAILLALLVAQSAQAQQPPANRSFWVIESNPRKQNYTMVRYYSADRKLIGEEAIRKPWIDIRKRRNIRMLDRMLKEWKARDTTLNVATAQKPKN